MSYQNGINTLQQLFTQVGAEKVSQPQTAAASTTSTPSTTGSSATAAPSDQASLSTLGGLAAATSVDGDDVRMDKVASLQAAINSGSYNVSSSDIADSLMNHMLQQ